MSVWKSEPPRFALWWQSSHDKFDWGIFCHHEIHRIQFATRIPAMLEKAVELVDLLVKIRAPEFHARILIRQRIDAVALGNIQRTNPDQ